MAMWGVLGGALAPLIAGLFGIGGKKTKPRYLPDPALQAQMTNLKAELEQHKITRDSYDQQIKDLNAKYEEAVSRHKTELENWQIRAAEQEKQLVTLTEEMKSMKIDNLTDLQKQDKKRFQRVIELCKELPPLPNMEGNQIGFFGLTGMGKSSLINACAGSKVCEEGLNQTTLEATPHRHPHSAITYWDLPGQTDHISYLTAPYIGLLKSLCFIGIVVDRSCDQMLRIIELIEAIGLGGRYHIIVNKVDLIQYQEEDNFPAAYETFKKNFEHEVAERKLSPRRIYYLSAKKRNLYDFLQFLNDITQ